jgi:hypothetical protein
MRTGRMKIRMRAVNGGAYAVMGESIDEEARKSAAGADLEIGMGSGRAAVASRIIWMKAMREPYRRWEVFSSFPGSTPMVLWALVGNKSR